MKMNKVKVLKLVRELVAELGYELKEIMPASAKKKMPKGIKRPGRKMHYDEFRFEDKCAALRVGECFSQTNVAGHKKSNLQAAMLNAAEKEFGAKRKVVTRTTRGVDGGYKITLTRIA